MPEGKREIVETVLYLEKETGPLPERGIAAGDWRDPDITLDCRGGWRVRSRDVAVEGHEQGAANEPDWAEFDTYLMNNTTFQTINLGRNPAPFFKQCWKEGRVIYGVLVGRDEQRHS